MVTHLPTLDRTMPRLTEIARPTQASNLAEPATQMEDLPTGLYAALEVALTEERAKPYQISLQAETASSSPAYYADNPQQGFSITFTPTGPQVKPTPGSSATWAWGLTVIEYGYGEQLRPPAVATLVATENRVAYERGELTEWYVNEAKGLEQGFTLDTPPEHWESKAAQPLQIRLALTGDLTPRLTADGQAIVLTTPDGETVHLYVTDAKGRDLPAWLALVEGQLALWVDDAAAIAVPRSIKYTRYPLQSCLDYESVLNLSGHRYTYPLTIDPVVVASQQDKLKANDGLGFSVAIDGNTAVVGAPGDDDAGDSSGSAYVFVRREGKWEQQDKLTADNAAKGDSFGRSVAMDENTVVLGAWGDDTAGSNAGAAYVFEWQ